MNTMTSLETNENSVVSEMKEPPVVYVSMVDSFLVEALQNPRHRLTILRMELDVQKFFQNSDLHMFVFPHFPTSYLRRAAHRVAQHYGLQTMVQDNAVDSQGSGILVIKKPDSKFPAICLSDVPVKEAENDKPDQIKIVIRPRASRGSSGDANELGTKRCSVRTVEERKEEYERARARIFRSSSGSESEYELTQVASDVRSLTLEENEVSRNLDVDGGKSISSRDTGSSLRVAIFRDKEKDRTDPDYDRRYERYVKSTPNTQYFSLAPCNLQKFQPPFLQYDSFFPQLHQMPAPQASLNYSGPVMSPYCAVGVNQTPRDALYLQWQTQSMMYAHSYNQMRCTLFQAPFCKQPLSFDYSQNH